MPLVPDQKLFEYRIVRVLGQGAFGIVYLAHDTQLDRPVAIKELSAPAQADETAFRRFLQEARAAGGLNHPHIVTVYALRHTKSDFYLVMEYLPGGSLRGLLNKRGRLQPDEAARLAAEVCEGLAAAHAKGIVHRDIKPENILLTADGHAKVSDFGIAHVPRGTGGTYRGGLTEAGFQPGTLLYMSPEQIRGQKVDGRSDVYQVGALLWEMLTGRHYVDVEGLMRRARETAGTNALRLQARLYELLEEAICQRAPEGIQGDVPAWLVQAVTSALAKDVVKRPQAEELAQALRQGEAAQAGRAATRGIIPTLLTKRAEAHATPRAATDDRSAQEHFRRGLIFLQQGRWDEAIREYQAALRINPEYAEAHYNLGVAYAEQGRLDEAIREWQAALRINPEYAEAHYGLGWAYEKQGRLDEAIREYQAAAKLGLGPARELLSRIMR